jgi:hypothetical protein
MDSSPWKVVDRELVYGWPKSPITTGFSRPTGRPQSKERATQPARQSLLGQTDNNFVIRVPPYPFPFSKLSLDKRERKENHYRLNERKNKLNY